MLRNRKHSRIRVVCLLAALTAPRVVESQLLTFNDTALPGCAYGCAPIYQAQYACGASSAPGGGSKDQWKCFCRSEYVRNIASGKGKSECDEVCSGGERKQVNTWVLEKCDEALGRGKPKNETRAVKPTPTPTPTRPPLKPTPTPTPDSDESEVDPETNRSWISKYWPFIVLGLVLLMLPLLAFALYRYLKPYYARRAIAVATSSRAGFRDGDAVGAIGVARGGSLFKKKHQRVDSHGRQYTTIPISDTPPVIPPINVLAKESGWRERRTRSLLGAREDQEGRREFSGETLTDRDPDVDLEMGLLPPPKKPIVLETTRSVSDSTNGSGTTQPPYESMRSVSDTSTGSQAPLIRSPASPYGTPPFATSTPNLSPKAQSPAAEVVAPEMLAVGALPPRPPFARSPRGPSPLGHSPPVEVNSFESQATGGIIPRPLADATPLAVVTAVDRTPSPGVSRQWSWEDGEEDDFEPGLGLQDIHPAYRNVDDYGAYPVGMRSQSGLRVVNTEIEDDGVEDWNSIASGVSSQVDEDNYGGEYEPMMAPAMPRGSMSYSPISPIRTPLHTLMEEDEEGLSRESSRRSRLRRH